jgi:membrane fusion protein (multidrug efflux system)
LALLSLSVVAGGAVPAAPPPTPSAVARATGKGDLPLTVASNLMVEHDLAVSTRVSGVVETIHVERGDVVKKGQALATLDQREFDLDRRAAEETLNVARADFERYRELREKNLVSQAEFEQKKAHHELARVEADRARLVIDRSVVRAPFDGVVVDRMVRAGQKVLVDENAALFRIAAPGPLLARVYLPEPAFRKVRVGDTVEVSATEVPGVKSAGRVSFLSPVVDAASGSVQVIVQVAPDPRRVLRSGMAVKITFAGAGTR